MSWKVQTKKRGNEIVGEGMISGIVPFDFQGQGHRLTFRIGQHWLFKQKEAEGDAVPIAPAARNKMYRAIKQLRNQSCDPSFASAA